MSWISEVLDRLSQRGASESEPLAALGAKHRRRVRRMVLGHSAATAVVSSCWTVYFAFMGLWIVVGLQLLAVGAAAVTTSCALHGRMRLASRVLIVAVYLLVCFGAIFIDPPVAGVNRSIHHFLIATGVMSCLLMRAERMWLRRLVPMTCFLTWAAFSSFELSIVTSIALPVAARAHTGWVNCFAAILMVYAALHVILTGRLMGATLPLADCVAAQRRIKEGALTTTHRQRSRRQATTGPPGWGTRWTRVKNLVLGKPGPQQSRVSHSLLATLIFVVFAGVQQMEVWGGLIEQRESNLLSAYNIAGALAFFALIRSGRNVQFTADPSLSFEQCLFGVTAICGSYAITGPARGGIMAIMLLILVFAMFALKPRKIQQLSALAVLGLGAVMCWKGLTDPVRYPALVEGTHALIAVILMSSISVLSLRMGSMRALLQQQKSDLQHALDENRRLATIDELTGLVNRRHIGSILGAENERQRRGGEPMSVALIDIDFFKRINDNHGHAAGDAVLRGFALLASATMRSGDTVSRWGGEEFLIVMPATDMAEAMRAIERLRFEFSTLNFNGVEDKVAATYSAGVATHRDRETIEELVERADRCMYAAKAGGRNRVCGDVRA